MQHTTPNDEDLILDIATHPQLDARCWELSAGTDHSGPALEKALATVFPAETTTCHQVAIIQKKPFWSVVATFIEYGFFKRKEQMVIPAVEQLPPPPDKHSMNEQTVATSRHPVVGHPWWDESTVFHEPMPVDNYLLMSHTS